MKNWLTSIILAMLLGGTIVYHFACPRIVYKDNPNTVVHFPPSKPDSVTVQKLNRIIERLKLLQGKHETILPEIEVKTYMTDSMAVWLDSLNNITISNKYGETKTFDLKERFNPPDTLISWKTFERETPQGLITSEVKSFALCPAERIENDINIDVSGINNSMKGELEQAKKKVKFWKTTTEITAALVLGMTAERIISH